MQVTSTLEVNASNHQRLKSMQVTINIWSQWKRLCYLHWLQTLMVTGIDFKCWWLLALTSNVDGYLHWLLMLMLLALTSNVDDYLHWLLMLMLLALTSNVDFTCIDLKCWCYLHWLLMLMYLALTLNVDVTCIDF